jgi:hypothetical protein
MERLAVEDAFSMKIDKWPAAPLLQIEATLQQGLPLHAKRAAAGQFWTFTMSNSATKVSEALVSAA